MLSTRACSGGFSYSPTTSRSFSTNRQPRLSLKVSTLMRLQPMSIPDALHRRWADDLHGSHGPNTPVGRDRRLAMKCRLHHSVHLADVSKTRTPGPRGILRERYDSFTEESSARSRSMDRFKDLSLLGTYPRSFIWISHGDKVQESVDKCKGISETLAPFAPSQCLAGVVPRVDPQLVPVVAVPA